MLLPNKADCRLLSWPTSLAPSSSHSPGFLHLSHVGLRPKSRVLGWSSRMPYPRSSSRSGRGGPRAMFTGIVEEMGRVRKMGGMLLHEDDGHGDGGVFHMTIEAMVVLEALHLGDSISVNGVCLTVTSFNAHSFTVGLSPETLRRTSLADAIPGSLLNLERALQPMSRMGGHFVQGHVDFTGTILSMHEEGDSLWLKIGASSHILRYVVPKGFIAVDGVSLTVCDVLDGECAFTLVLVAYTRQKVTLPSKKVGNKVNLEVDILGKYVERLLKGSTEPKS